MSSNTQNSVAISVDNVSKLFRLQKQRTFKELLPALFGGKKVSESFWALRDVNFSVGKGETIGIIGSNGSGKSTLLKMIAGVSKPTKGSVQVHGKIAPLIELGAGFHPELTGRENVFLNGIILGMKREEVEKKFKSIVDFAELCDFIDQPVKHFSSGMYLRLAFAVAVHTDPDILLVDEILAVGDSKFQAKCLAKIRDMVTAGVTLVIVSHDLKMIEKYCEKVVVIEKGTQKFYGDSTEAVVSLNRTFFEKKTDQVVTTKNTNEWGDKKVTISKIELLDATGNSSRTFSNQSSMTFKIHVDNPNRVPDLNCSIGIYRDDDVYISGFSTYFDEIKIENTPEGVFSLNFEKIYLNTGVYYVRVCIFSTNEDSPHHFIHKPLEFSIQESLMTGRGAANLPHSWSYKK